MTQELIKQPIKNLPEGMTQEDIFIHLLQGQKELKKSHEVMAGDLDYLKKQTAYQSFCWYGTRKIAQDKSYQCSWRYGKPSL